MLLIKVEVDADCLEVLDGAQQIDQRPAKPVNRPGHHDVELAPAGILEHRVKARALVAPLGAADAGVAVGRDHGPAPALCDLPELLELVVDGLVIGADADVERSALCRLRQVVEPSQIESSS